MSVEYIDGSFSENMPAEEAFRQFAQAFEDGTARALHVGTEVELNKIKKKRSIEEELETLKMQVKALQEPPTKSEHIVIPTKDEIIQFLRSKNIPTVD